MLQCPFIVYKWLLRIEVVLFYIGTCFLFCPLYSDVLLFVLSLINIFLNVIFLSLSDTCMQSAIWKKSSCTKNVSQLFFLLFFHYMYMYIYIYVFSWQKLQNSMSIKWVEGQLGGQWEGDGRYRVINGLFFFFLSTWTKSMVLQYKLLEVLICFLC